jgi:hypothetical protein
MAPNAWGSCTTAQLVDTAEVNQTQSLDTVLNLKLNKNALNPRVTVTGNSALNSSAEMSGVSITASQSLLPLIDVVAQATLEITYNYSNSFKSTFFENIEFNIVRNLISGPFLRAKGTLQSTLVLNSVVFGYTTTLEAPLLSLDTFGSIQLTNVTVIKKATTAGKVVDQSGNVCGLFTDSPALLIRSSVAIINSSTFENIDTG